MIIVSLLAVLVAGFYLFQRTQRERYVKHTPVLSEASVEKLPFGFLSFLIFGRGAEVVEGSVTSTDPSGSTLRYQVLVKTALQQKDLYEEYLEYFKRTGWNIVSQEGVEPNSLLVVSRGSFRVRLMIVSASGGGTLVRIYQTSPPPREI